MNIVTDTGMDMHLPPGQMPDMEISVVRQTITLDGRTYRSGEDIQGLELQNLLARTHSFPVTSQPSAGDFAAVYRRLAATDPDILSIHMSSGLSGTLNAARAGAEMTPEARVTLVDTKTLSAALGWQVAAAARALRAGWPLDKIVALIDRIGAASESLYTLDDLKYLIHGGRISHMKGLIASLLNIKPLIGVEKVGGTYVQKGQARTFKGAVKGLVDQMLRVHPEGTRLMVQVLYALNPEGAAFLKEEIARRFQCDWLPMGPMSLVLGAHTGRSMVGVAYVAQAALVGLP